MHSIFNMNSTSKPIAGQMRFNEDKKWLEAYTGTNWIKIHTTGNVTPYRLDVSEGRVHGARYYTVEPINADDRWQPMMEWVLDTFGPCAIDGVWTPNMRWYANNSKFWFRNKKDMDWFVLRWSS